MERLLYVELAEKIMVETLSSNLTPGSKIDSVRVMAIRYQANPKTIQKAFEYLDGKGIFTTVIGGGRYLSSNEDVLKKIKQELIWNEIEQFTQKMKMYECDLRFIHKQISLSYHRKEQSE